MRGCALLQAFITTELVLASKLYCPKKNDMDFSGNVTFKKNGWTLTGPGNVHGLTSYNLLGGYVSFTMDTSNAADGVNTNLYTISPDNGVENSGYCDIQVNDSPQCMEMDIIENNGNCLMATTWHVFTTDQEYNQETYGNCDPSGCAAEIFTPNVFLVNATFSKDGYMMTTMNGQELSGLDPWPSDDAKSIVAGTMSSVGASLWSSQWEGWVPGSDMGCPPYPGGNSYDNPGPLLASSYTVSDLRVYGTVMQGPKPTLCDANLKA